MKVLLLINVAVFVANMIAFPLFGSELGTWLGVSWPMLWEFGGLGLVRVLTYQFVHSFSSPFHILGNMLVLYFFGTMVGGSIGKARLIQLYLIAGVVGAIVQMLFSVMLDSVSVTTIGASGAVYGILAYAACMAPRATVYLLFFPVELRWLAVGLVSLGVYMTYVDLVGAGSDGVAHGGHIGGALWGYLAYRMPTQRWSLGQKVQRWQAQREAESAAEKQRRLDELLEKVHKQGLNALTSGERKFLDRASKDLRGK